MIILMLLMMMTIEMCTAPVQAHSVLDCFEGMLRRLHDWVDVVVVQVDEDREG